jgi:ABC-type phosphate transport system substrate-binding protein
MKKLILFVLVLLSHVTSLGLPTNLVFIVNDQTDVSSLKLTEIKDIYFKRNRQWPNGTAIRFIDRGAHTDLRKIFVSTILKMSDEDLDQYWIGQKLYTGDSAPLQQPSETLTLQLVSSLKGSISYVSSDTVLPSKGVKAIKVDNGEF